MQADFAFWEQIAPSEPMIVTSRVWHVNGFWHISTAVHVHVGVLTIVNSGWGVDES